MSRIQARDLAFKLIFSMEFTNSNEDLDINFIRSNNEITFNEDSLNILFDENEISADSDKEFCLALTNAYLNNKNKIDDLLQKHVTGYSVKRVYKCDLAILKLAIAEMMSFDYDYKIVINEAVELAKKYSEEKSYKFVHGVLSKVVKELFNE
ncbi:MAG: transcription antitermination factor NusB [Clostridia bacterium]|nr:transcription antitermination factor NusB [Clostridia bacterium]